MGRLLGGGGEGGAKGMFPPLKLLGGLAPLTPPPSSYAYVTRGVPCIVETGYLHCIFIAAAKLINVISTLIHRCTKTLFSQGSIVFLSSLELPDSSVNPACI